MSHDVLPKYYCKYNSRNWDLRWCFLGLCKKSITTTGISSWNRSMSSHILCSESSHPSNFISISCFLSIIWTSLTRVTSWWKELGSSDRCICSLDTWPFPGCVGHGTTHYACVFSWRGHLKSSTKNTLSDFALTMHIGPIHTKLSLYFLRFERCINT